MQRGAGCKARLRSTHRGEAIRALRPDRRCGSKGENADVADNRAPDRNRASRTDGDVSSRDLNGPALRIQNRLALGGNQHSVVSTLETAVPRITDTIPGLDREKALPFDGDIQRIAGDGEGALAKINLIAAQHAEVVHRTIQLVAKCAGAHQGRAEIFPLRSETLRTRVCQIACCRVKRLGTRQPAGKCRVESAAHLPHLFLARKGARDIPKTEPED